MKSRFWRNCFLRVYCCAMAMTIKSKARFWSKQTNSTHFSDLPIAWKIVSASSQNPARFWLMEVCTFFGELQSLTATQSQQHSSNAKTPIPPSLSHRLLKIMLGIRILGQGASGLCEPLRHAGHCDDEGWNRKSTNHRSVVRCELGTPLSHSNHSNVKFTLHFPIENYWN